MPLLRTGELQATKLNVESQSPLVDVGDLIATFRSSLKQGFLWCDGRSIGNSASGATARADADTFELFSMLWAAPGLQMQNSAGVLWAKGGSAASDFNANFRMLLPDMRGRSLAGLDNLGGTAAGVDASAAALTAGGVAGAAATVLTIAQLPQHNHGVNVFTAGAHTHTITNQARFATGASTGSNVLVRSTNTGTVTSTSTESTASTDPGHTHFANSDFVGSGSPVTLLNPRLYCYYQIRYI